MSASNFDIVGSDCPYFQKKQNKSDPLIKQLDLPAISGLLAIMLAMGLALVGAIGAAGILQGSTFGWIVLGASVALTALSAGVLSPATIVTIILAVLGLTGVLPFTAVGIGVAVTMALGLIGGFCICKTLE